MKTETQLNQSDAGMARRAFLRYAGAGVAVAGLAAVGACKKDKNNPNNGLTDVGSGDIGVLNYAYALEQLEAAFYIQVADTSGNVFNNDEKSLLGEIRDHEVAHREFFRKALKDKAIKDLTPDFSAINFGDRTSILTAAKAFEDLGVTAYNGIAFKITSADILTVAGKIVSVEARHAALISNLINPGSFVNADQVDLATGLNKSNGPNAVLAAANMYLKTKVSASSFNF
ncbi:ferritin-like domain-containing protein [Mucilaginibacter hurinus]|uniref:Ferritin-like domain-containing protein n=1 Tax=Mucilaginibacter hurinus TaxID=2201324 RepID=A0A367GM02_9SPHI|nr:ferritin-like domain-containing protein [Mucilaginibacter hurinus]RCH53896.1 ferritin-like domain-containing protein [Mucilaginibacter hurinus]